MHVALVAKDWWLGAELASHRALAAALRARQVELTAVWPDDAPEDWLAAAGNRVLWRPGASGRRRTQRLVDMAEPLRRVGVDVIHALDGEVWAGGAQLGERLGIPVLFSCDRAAEVAAADHYHKATQQGAAAFVAGTVALGEALTARLGVAVACVPPGIVTADRESDTGAAPGEAAARSVLIRGDGSCDRETLGLLRAIGQVCAVGSSGPGMHFFYDGQGADLHELWRAVRRLELLAQFSMVPAGLAGRQVLLRADVLIQPQAHGAVQAMTLAAMAHGAAVLARQDRWLDYLIHDQTAVVLESPDVAEWRHWLERYLKDPAYFQALAARAQRWVREHHNLEKQADLLAGLYQRLAGEAIPFPRR
jgi:hypothetical protein